MTLAHHNGPRLMEQKSTRLGGARRGWRVTASGSLGDVRLQDPDGAEVALASYFGQPLVVVCVRYYG